MTNKWISVEDRLPEIYTRTIIYLQRKNLISIGVFVDIKSNVWVNFYGDEFDPPTHWMPLPEPPKIDGEKKEIIQSNCKCGEKFLIKINSNASFRCDRKRVFYPDDKITNNNVFRCRKCEKPVHETVPGAEYE